MSAESDEYLERLKAEVRMFDDIPFVDCIRIQKAAKILNVEVDDLIHDGAVGDLDIFAPVICAGSYEWLAGPERNWYPELNEPVRAYFDASDRVILSSADLLRIEAVGWAVPENFYSPAKAAEADWILRQVAQGGSEQYEPEHVITSSRKIGDVEHWRMSYTPAKLVSPDALLDKKRRMTYRIARWHSIEPLPSDAERTTRDHLFVSTDQIDRLLASKKEKDPHGNTINNALVNEDILKAAIYCKAQRSDDCKQAADWLVPIETNAKLFWTEMVPPYSTEKITDLLNEALKRGDEPISVKKIKLGAIKSKRNRHTNKSAATKKDI